MCDTVLALAGPLGAPLTRVIQAGGKRLRPALTVAVAGIGGSTAEDPRVLAAAAAVELLHCAALVHDDLIDGAALRRGVATVSAQEGAAAAVVGGDLLISAAFLLAGEAGPGASVIIAETLAQLCRGEALQDQLRYDALAPVGGLMEVTRLKTGSLLRAACLLGARSSGAARAVRRRGRLRDGSRDLPSARRRPARRGVRPGAGGQARRRGFLHRHADAADRAGHPRLPGARPAAAAGPAPAQGDRAMKLLQQAAGALAATAATARDYAGRAAQHLRAAARDQAGAEPLSRWPASYLASQLQSQVAEQHRWLVTPLASLAP